MKCNVRNCFRLIVMGGLFLAIASCAGGVGSGGSNLHRPGVTRIIAFEPVPSPRVAGYRVYYGMQSRKYENSLDIGDATQFKLSGLRPDTVYYIAVVAYDEYRNEGDFSEELVVDTAGGKAE